MITTRSALALALALVAAGCGAGESDTSPAPASPGYGYEFRSDRVASPAAPAPIPARVEGRLAPELIQSVMRGGFGALAPCAANGALAGELTVRFTVLPDGTVGEARAEEAADREAAAGCVVKAIRGLRFPVSSAGTATVVYPLVF